MNVKPSSVTLAEVGKRVGVSGVTVSNVINNRGGTSVATQAKVWAAIRETGYVANLAARSPGGGAKLVPSECLSQTWRPSMRVKSCGV